jgi:hypothetical protein
LSGASATKKTNVFVTSTSDSRPSFAEIINWLETILQSSGEYLELTQNTVNNATYLHPNPSFGNYDYSYILRPDNWLQKEVT